MNRNFKKTILTAIIIIMVLLSGACGRQTGPQPISKEKPVENQNDLFQELNAVNLKNSSFYGGFLCEDDKYFYYVNDSDKDIYRYNKEANEKALFVDLESQFTGFLNIYDGKIYFVCLVSTPTAAATATSAVLTAPSAFATAHSTVIQVPSVYVVNMDGSGIKKLFDNAINLIINNKYAYYLDYKSNKLFKYDLLTEMSTQVLDNAVNSYDIVNDKIYCIESANPGNNIDLSIIEYNIYSKEKKVLLSSVGLDPEKQKRANVGKLQYYKGSLYYIENLSIKKYSFETGQVETIAVSPITLNLSVQGLLVSSKGIYFYISVTDTALRTSSLILYNVEAKINQIYKYDTANVLSVNMAKNYIIIHVMDTASKSIKMKIIDYEGNEIQLDL